MWSCPDTMPPDWAWLLESGEGMFEVNQSHDIFFMKLVALDCGGDFNRQVSHPNDTVTVELVEF